MGSDLYLENLYANRGPCTRKHCDEGRCDSHTQEELNKALTDQRFKGFRDGLDFAIRAAHRNRQSEAYIAYLEEVRRSDPK